MKMEPRITMRLIGAVTAEHFEISPVIMFQPGRGRHIAWPRHVAIYLARRLTDASLKGIGRRFADTDYTSIMHAINNVRERPELLEAARTIEQRILAGLDVKPIDRPCGQGRLQ